MCKGVAAELDLKISGRRNALGSVVSRRRSEWFSSTSALLAHVARSNTNVQHNYRVPLNATTHDADCTSPACRKMVSTRLVCLIAQRAMRQMTGYFGGYISKRQKIGQFEIKKSVGTLPLLQEKLEARELKTASSQLAHVVNRMFTTLEGKGILRMATEEFLLSSRYKPHDPLAAEFIRTFRHRNFPGKFFLDRYEALIAQESQVDVRIILPKQAIGKGVVDVVSLYGFRPTTSDIFFLSPWEYVQWIRPERLRRPSAQYNWTKWTAAGKLKLAKTGADGDFEAGEDFILNEDVLKQLPHIYTFPEPGHLFKGQAPATYKKFRQTWLLRKRQRPVVPAPELCPMPNRRKSKATRSKILSVYLRPWTLFPLGATTEVPFLAHLHVPRNQTTLNREEKSDSASAVQMRAAWKEYTQQVFPHAFIQVRNFMLASISEGRNCEDLEEGLKRGQSIRCKLSQADVEKALELHADNLSSSIAQGEDTKKTNVAKKVLQSAHLAVDLSRLILNKHLHAVAPACNITNLQWTPPAGPSSAQGSASETFHSNKAATCDVKTFNWQERYAAWRKEVFENAKSHTPNAQQSIVLDLVHERRLVEFAVENGQSIPEASSCPHPLLRLIHGLPGFVRD